MADDSLGFWLGSVEQYRSEIERGLDGPIAPVLGQRLDVAMSGPWEEAFRLRLRRMAAAGDLGADVVAVGPWWAEGRDTTQIDAVVLSGCAEEAILAGEAKWARFEDGARIVRGLEREVERLPRRREPLTFAVCARAPKSPMHRQQPCGDCAGHIR